MTDEPAYKVGRNRPPLHSRFKKGKSGNPAGRPKGHRNLAATLAHVLGEATCLEVDGEETEMTKLEAVMRGLVDRAIAGDSRLTGQLLAEIHKNEAAAELEASAQALGPADEKVLQTLYARLTKEALARMKGG